MKKTLMLMIVGLAGSLYLLNLMGVDIMNLYHWPSLVIVGVGSLFASIATFGLSRMRSLWQVMSKVLSQRTTGTKDMVVQVLQLAKHLNAEPEEQKKRHVDFSDGKHHPFLLDGIHLLEDHYSPEEIDYIMGGDISERKNRHGADAHALFTMAKYPIACGVFGALVGMAIMIPQIKGGTIPLRVMMPSVLSLLYGFSLSFFVFTPLVQKVFHRFNEDIEQRQIIVKGLVLIAKGGNPKMIEKNMAPLIKPSIRNTQSLHH